MNKENEVLKTIDDLLDNYIDEAQVVDCPMTKERLIFLKQTLVKELEQEKILKTIKEKGVDIASINMYQSVVEYNWSIRFERHKRKELTDEEFNMLKE